MDLLCPLVHPVYPIRKVFTCDEGVDLERLNFESQTGWQHLPIDNYDPYLSDCH